MTASLVFHLGGRHDQKLHGRRGPGMAPEVKADYREMARRMIPAQSGEDAGFTYDPHTRAFPTTGFAVSPFETRTQKIEGPAKAYQIARFALRNSDLIKAYPGKSHLGGWYENSTNTSHMDISLVVDTHAKAQSIARDHDQQSYFDLSTFKYYDRHGAFMYGEEDLMDDIYQLRYDLALKVYQEFDMNVRQVFPDSLIAERDGKIFGLSYGLDLTTGALTISSPIPMELIYRASEPGSSSLALNALEGVLLEFASPTGGDLHVDGLAEKPQRPKGCIEKPCEECEGELRQGCDWAKRASEEEAQAFHLGTGAHDQKKHGRRGPGGLFGKGDKADPKAAKGKDDGDDDSLLGRADRLAERIPDKSPAAKRAVGLYGRFREFHYNHPIIASYLTTTAIKMLTTAAIVGGMALLDTGFGPAYMGDYYVPPVISSAEPKPKDPKAKAKDPKKGPGAEEKTGPTEDDVARLCDEFEMELERAVANASSKERKARVRASEDGEGEDEDVTGTYRLFVEAERAFSSRVAPDWIPFLPKAGSYSHPKFGKIALSAKRISAFVENFKAAIYQKMIPLDAEHQTKLSGAVAWITDLRLNADGSADARVEWTDRGLAFLENDRFRYISPEWYDRWEDPATGRSYENVIVGGALTTRPFFKDGSLRPLIASEDAWFSPGDEAEPEDGADSLRGNEPGTTDGQLETPSTGGTTVAEGSETTSVTLSEEEARQFAEMKAKTESLEMALRSANEVAEAQAKELKAAAEQLAAIRTESRRKGFREAVMGADEGTRWFGEPEKHVTFMEAIAERFGEDSEEMAWYRGLNSAFAEQIKTSAVFSEAGSVRKGGNAGTEGEQLRAMTDARMKEKGVDYTTAFKEIASENEGLYRSYINSTQGRV